MSSARYYGRKLDTAQFEGRLGDVVRGLNQVRAFAERATEAAIAVYAARSQEVPIKPVLRKLLAEGMAEPVDILVRPPVDVRLSVRETQPEITSRFYPSRDYSARVGRVISLEAVREREPSRYEDEGLNLFVRYGARGRLRGQDRTLPPLVCEDFEEVHDARPTATKVG